MNRLRLSFILLLLLPLPALAQELSGYAEVKGFAYAERSNSRDPWSLGWGTLLTKWETQAGETQLTAVLRGEAISDNTDGALRFDPADRKLRRSPLAVPELWLRYPLAPALDLQLGRFQLGWGKTDGYSPADAFLPRDLTDPFSDEKLPLWALRLSGERAGLRFEVVAVPITTPWRLAPLGSRHTPLNVSGLPAGTSYQEIETSPPTTGFAALRLLRTSGDWDLGAWGRFGVRPAPLLDFRFDQAIPTASGSIILVERRYTHEAGGGIELSRVVGPYVLRGEGAALFSADRELEDALIGALSAERSFGDNTLLVTLAGNAIDPPVASTQLFDRALLPALIVAWNRSEEWGAWKLVWTAGLNYGDGLLKGEIGYNLTDTWKVTTSGDLPYGSEAGPLGSLQSARRLQLALRRSW